MTPQERAQKVVAEIASVIKAALDDALPDGGALSDGQNVALPTHASRLAAELAFNKSRTNHDPVTDSSLTYGDLRRLAKQRELLIEAERAVEEYSCRTSVPHIATEMSGLASRIRTALSEEHQQVSDAA